MPHPILVPPSRWHAAGSGAALCSKDPQSLVYDQLAVLLAHLYCSLPDPSVNLSPPRRHQTQQNNRPAMDSQDSGDYDFPQSGPVASTSGRSDAEQLKGALMNEKASPEILHFETDLVARIEQNVDYQVRCSVAQGPVVGGAQVAAGGASRHSLTFIARRPPNCRTSK